MRILFICRSLRYESSIGAVPYIRQLIAALRKSAYVDVLETEAFDPTIVGRVMRRYFGQTSDFGQFKQLRRGERDVNLVLIMHEYDWLTRERLHFLRDRFPRASIWFYDYEVPLNLPENATNPRYGGSPFLRKTNRWDMVDGLVIPSLGAAKRVQELTGVSRVRTFYFCVDPATYTSPITAKSHDLCFMGKSRYYREEEIEYMLNQPATRTSYDAIDSSHGDFDFPSFIQTSKLSRINLSITRRPFAECYASSVSRPFELAAMGCCIVSNPCKGLDVWFDKGREIEVVSSWKEAIELYNALLEDDERRLRMGENARLRVLRDHDVNKRAPVLLEQILGRDAARHNVAMNNEAAV